MRNTVLLILSSLLLIACGDDNIEPPKYFVSPKLSSEAMNARVLHYIFGEDKSRLNVISNKMWQHTNEYLGVASSEAPVEFKHKLGDMLQHIDYKALRQNYEAAHQIDFTDILNGMHLGERVIIASKHLDAGDIVDSSAVLLADVSDKKLLKSLKGKGARVLNAEILNSVMRKSLTDDLMLRYFFEKPFGYRLKKDVGSSLPTSRRGRLDCCVFDVSGTKLNNEPYGNIRIPTHVPIYMSLENNYDGSVHALLMGGFQNIRLGLKHSHLFNSNQRSVVSATYVDRGFFAEYSVGLTHLNSQAYEQSVYTQNLRLGFDCKWVSPFIGASLLSMHENTFMYGVVGIEADAVSINLGYATFDLKAYLNFDFRPNKALGVQGRLESTIHTQHGVYAQYFMNMNSLESLGFGVTLGFVY